jgi:hypothetical protein
MAHFLGGTRGNRSSTSRLGTKQSGIASHAQGWDIGGDVSVWYDKKNDRDIVTVTITHGSNGNGMNLFIGRYYLDDGEIMRLDPIDKAGA